VVPPPPSVLRRKAEEEERGRDVVVWSEQFTNWHKIRVCVRINARSLIVKANYSRTTSQNTDGDDLSYSDHFDNGF
jgi:hypothetical protein